MNSSILNPLQWAKNELISGSKACLVQNVQDEIDRLTHDGKFTSERDQETNQKIANLCQLREYLKSTPCDLEILQPKFLPRVKRATRLYRQALRLFIHELLS